MQVCVHVRNFGTDPLVARTAVRIQLAAIMVYAHKMVLACVNQVTKVFSVRLSVIQRVPTADAAFPLIHVSAMVVIRVKHAQ